MANQTQNMVKLGIFVTVGMALFVAGIYYLGNSKNLFGSNFTVFADFANVQGLQNGNNVRYMGITVGSVKEIFIINDSTIRVEMTVKEEIQDHLRKDAIVSIGADGLVGGALIDINAGEGKLPSAEDGDLLPSVGSLETGEILQSLGSTTQKIDILAKNLVDITQKINHGEGTLGMLLSDSTLSDELKASIQNLTLTGKNLTNLSKELNHSVESAVRGEGLIGFLLTDSTIMPRMQNMVEKTDLLIDRQATPAFAELKKSTEEISVFTNEIKTMVEEINAGKGTVGMLLKDEKTDLQIQDILKNLDESSIKLNENMEALQHNWFFRRYFKKKAKQQKK